MTGTEGATSLARRVGVTGLAVAAAGVLAGCLADSSPTGGGGSTVPVSVSVTLPRQIGTPTRPGGPSFSVTVNDGINEIVMDRIDIVIRDLQLKPEDVTSCGSGECITYVEGPAVLPLPTEGNTLRLATEAVDVARYDRLDVGLHVPAAGDPVTGENPEFEGVSVLAEGTYNGEPFTFESDVTVEMRLDLSPAVVLESGALGANVTLLAGVTGWFVDQGSGLVDPRTANEGGENEALVESNIQNSFQAYRDDDLDGAPGS